MKIVAPGHMVNGKPMVVDRNGLLHTCSQVKDCEINLIIDTDVHNKTKKQQGYYWAVLVPHTLIILRDICGYSEYRTIDDAHEFLKYMFNPLFVPNPENPDDYDARIRLPGSTKGMKKELKMIFIDSIIMWGWEKFQYTYPPPKRKEDKYYFN